MSYALFILIEGPINNLINLVSSVTQEPPQDLNNNSLQDNLLKKDGIKIISVLQDMTSLQEVAINPTNHANHTNHTNHT